MDNPILSGQMNLIWRKTLQTKFGLVVMLAVAEEGDHFRSIVTVASASGLKSNVAKEHWPSLKEAKLSCAALTMGAANELYNDAAALGLAMEQEDESVGRVSSLVLPGSEIVLPAGVEV